MPLDPQAEDVLKARAAVGNPPVESIPPHVARANYEATPRERGPEVARVQDRKIPTLGGDVPVRCYWPGDAGPYPALVWLHGGGWLVGSLDSTDAACRHLANRAGIAVVSVDYSLSPEAKFPRALNECHGVARWLAEHGPEVSVDPARIAVGGASAGGNLAAAVALKARDEGGLTGLSRSAGVKPSRPFTLRSSKGRPEVPEGASGTGLEGSGPAIAMQLLVYPVLSFDMDTESYRLFGQGYGLNAGTMAYYARCYLASDADARSPYAAPLCAKDLSGLPPACIITAECDPLRDEGETYARRLQEAGVPTTCTRYDGMVHAFFNFPVRVTKTRQALEQAAAALKQALFTGL